MLVLWYLEHVFAELLVMTVQWRRCHKYIIHSNFKAYRGDGLCKQHVDDGYVPTDSFDKPLKLTKFNQINREYLEVDHDDPHQVHLLCQWL